MQPWPGPVSPGWRPEDSVAARRACLALTAGWALAGTALSLWVFRAWMEPLPAFDPNDGPIVADANMSFWVGGTAMAIPLAVLSIGSAVTGSLCLASIRPAWPAWTGWVGAVTAAVAVEVMFIGVFILPGVVLGMSPGQVNAGILVLSASFAAAGAAMITIVMTAARRARQSGRARG